MLYVFVAQARLSCWALRFFEEHFCAHSDICLCEFSRAAELGFSYFISLAEREFGEYFFSGFKKKFIRILYQYVGMGMRKMCATIYNDLSSVRLWSHMSICVVSSWIHLIERCMSIQSGHKRRHWNVCLLILRTQKQMCTIDEHVRRYIKLVKHVPKLFTCCCLYDWIRDLDIKDVRELQNKKKILQYREGMMVVL